MAKLKFELLPSETVEVKKKFMRGVSLNQFINVAVAEKLAHLEHDLRGCFLQSTLHRGKSTPPLSKYFCIRMLCSEANAGIA